MSNLQKNVRAFIMNHISFEGYDIDNTKNAIENVYDIWMQEHGNYRRKGYIADFKDWLMGLPTVLSVPFYYWDINQIMKETFKYTYTRTEYKNGKKIESQTFDWMKTTSDNEISDKYFHLIAKTFMQWYWEIHPNN